MSQNTPNERIRCRVESCAFNCPGQECCGLQAIRVEPCGGETEGNESKCASFRKAQK